MITRYKIISSMKELKLLIKACKTTKYACFDFETSGTPIYGPDFYPTILSVSFQVGSSIVIPLNHFDSPLRDKEKGGNGQWLKYLTLLGRQVIENPNITKVAWNWKFDNQIMSKYKIYSRGYAIDGMLAKYLLEEERPMGLKDMVVRYIPEMGGYEDYEGSKLPWDKKPLEGLAKYGGQDTDATLRLSLFFEKKLIDLGFYSLFRNLIMMASRVLQDAEQGGMKLDIDFNNELRLKYDGLITDTMASLMSMPRVRKFSKHLIEERKEAYISKINEEIDELDNKIKADPSRASAYNRQKDSRVEKKVRVRNGEPATNDEKAIFEPLNLSSVKQMSDLLYTSPKGFKFPIIAYTKDKYNKPTQNPSTAEETILELKKYDKVGFITKLLELRKLITINSTFIQGIGDKVGADGRIHPTFNIHGTTTGRMSCVSGETLVCTDLGDIPIIDLCPKEMGEQIISAPINALTHTGSYKPITMGINKGKEQMYMVTLEDGSNIKATLNHIFITNLGKVKLKEIYRNFQNNPICKYKLLKLSHE